MEVETEKEEMEGYTYVSIEIENELLETEMDLVKMSDEDKHSSLSPAKSFQHSILF
jgi:hypothetical protein